MCLSKAKTNPAKAKVNPAKAKINPTKPMADWTLPETREMLAETTRLLVRVLEECKGSQGITLPCAPDPELLEEIQELVQQIEPDERITRAKASGEGQASGGSENG
jgi:hypothetical protein